MPDSEIIRPFQLDDIPFALDHARQEGWSTSRFHYELCVQLNPDGCFVAMQSGMPIGMVTTTRFGKHAWIGDLIVSHEHRRRGIGRQLFETGISYLTALGVTSIELEADPDGVALYQSLGFREVFRSPRYAIRSDSGAGGEGIGLNDNKALADVIAFDAARSGYERGELLSAVWKQSAGRFVARQNNQISGYVLVSATNPCMRIGPWLADDTKFAESLLLQILKAISGELIVAVPGSNLHAGVVLLKHQFECRGDCLRMMLGADAPIVQDATVYALCDGATG